MDKVVLKNQKVQATFSPLNGMNLLALTKNNIAIIDPKTLPLFEERFAGLGSLIGPHFYHRHQIPPVASEDLFPHIARVKAKGTLDPFSHGIARYAPWKAEVSEDSIKATLSSSDFWNGSSLASLEGFDFEMSFFAELLMDGIVLDYSVQSDKPSVIGLHYYYALPSTGGTIKASIENIYRIQDDWKPIPTTLLDSEGNLLFDADQEADFGFIPKLKNGFFEILYENAEYTLKIRFQTENKEASFQIYRPKESSYICIEPLSAKDPKKPLLKSSRLKSLLEFQIAEI
jgi:hypothetical protein